MLYPIEKETDKLLWICPQCGKLVRFPNAQAARLAEQTGRCMDCRAENTLRKHPELTWLFYDFSKRTGKKYSCLANKEELKDNPRPQNILPFKLPA